MAENMQQPFAMPRAGSFLLRSEDGDAYRIDLWTPDGPAPAEGWPAVFLLDAGGVFGTAVEAVRRMSRRPDATGVGPTVVVGISALGEAYDTARRQRDFTSPRAGDGAETGGAAAFLAFIETRVKPAVAARAAIDPRRHTLFGHSLAGYFALWTLATHPHAFSAYAAISPSIWWDRDALLGAFGKDCAGRGLLLCVGGWEDALPPWQAALPGSEAVAARRAARQMVDGARSFAAAVAPYLGAENIAFRLLEEEDHASIVSAAVPRMLRMASLPAPHPAGE